MKVITWNVLNGNDEGDRNQWLQRKPAFQAALEQEQPEIFCVQEALPGQLEFFDKILPRHARAGVGRDDGKNKGEFCAIYFDQQRFELVETKTFWLSDTPDVCGQTWDLPYQRICTWVRLKDAKSGATFRVYNTHFPLIPAARTKSAALLVERIKQAAGEPCLVMGDFNCPCDSEPLLALQQLGLIHCVSAAGKKASAPTFHKLGFGLACLDHIFATKDWKVSGAAILDASYNKVYPSDHFGVRTTVEIGGQK